MKRLWVLGLAFAAAGGCSSKDGFDSYMTKSKESEAQVNLRAIARGAEAYFEAEHVGRDSLAVVTGRVPAGSVGPTPALGTCCKGDKKMCAPAADAWSHPTWRALAFEVAAPHYFSYEYRQVGTPGEAGYGFEAYAYGDLDCDGTYSTFSSTAAVKPDLGEGLVSSGAITKVKAGE